jgi:3-isopropylmalate dehydrogenase
MMLDWLAERHGEPRLDARARLIERALEAALSGGHVPIELGGRANCAEMTRATIEALPAAMREVA